MCWFAIYILHNLGYPAELYCIAAINVKLLCELNFTFFDTAGDNIVQPLIFPVWKSLPLQIQKKIKRIKDGNMCFISFLMQKNS